MSRMLTNIIRAVVPLCLAMMPVAHATSHDGTSKNLEGTWCSQDGETIVQYFVSGSNVTALTVLSETDPRRVGSSTSLALDEARVLTSGSYHRCDQRQAWARAQAFLSSPAAEAATRKALQVEQMQREDAEVAERRNAERDAYFAELLQQLNFVRRSRSI